MTYVQHIGKTSYYDYVIFFNLFVNHLIFKKSLIAPLLGKEYQKPYIQRFAAESFAFLLRKARGNNLTEIINYIIASVYESPSEIYCRGLSMLFSEAAKVYTFTVLFIYI
jgi:hypothetical protein